MSDEDNMENQQEATKEQMERIRKTLESKKHKELWARVQTFYDHQKIRIAQNNRIYIYGKLGLDMSGLQWYPDEMKRLEERFQKEMLDLIKNEPVWKVFLKNVKGIGPVMAGGLIAWFDDPAKASSPSKMWKYAGLGVTDGHADRKVKGSNDLGFNPKLKTHMWKIGKQLMFARGKYYEYYLQQKEYAMNKHKPKVDVSTMSKEEKLKYFKEHPDEWMDGKIHAYAFRKMVKLFLANFWEAWRKSEGLDTPPPYAEAILGHVDIIHYWEMMDRVPDIRPPKPSEITTSIQHTEEKKP
mgnify:FL=1